MASQRDETAGAADERIHDLRRGRSGPRRDAVRNIRERRPRRSGADQADGGAQHQQSRGDSDAKVLPVKAFTRRRGGRGEPLRISAPPREKVLNYDFGEAAADFAKSPAFTIVIFDGSIHFLIAALTCSCVRSEIFFSSAASQASVRFVKSSAARVRDSPASCARPSLRLSSRPFFASAISAGVKPSFTALSASSLNAVSSFAAFCGA